MAMALTSLIEPKHKFLVQSLFAWMARSNKPSQDNKKAGLQAETCCVVCSGPGKLGS